MRVLGNRLRGMGAVCAALGMFLCLAGVTRAGAAQVALNPPRDNTLYSNDPNLSCGIGSHLISGRTDGGVLRRAVLYFDVAAGIPAGSMINSVSLSIVVNRVRDNQARTFALHRLTQDWGEGASDCDGSEGQGAPAQTDDATWQHRLYPSTAWGSLGGSFDGTPSASASIPNSNGNYSWTGGNLVTDVQSMVDNPGGNFGWIVIGGESTNKTARRFFSGDEGQVSRRPVLLVDFTPPSGSEACCTAEGFCSLEPPASCAGTVLSGVTTCTPNPCPQPQGACCSALGDCQVIGEADCLTQGDTFQGAGTTCDPSPCAGAGLEKFVDALPIPAIATPVSGSPGAAASYDLAITEFQQQLHRDLPPTTVWGYGGSYPGPTIVASRNEPVVVTWTNDLRDLATGQLRTSHYLAVDTCPHGPNYWNDLPRIVTHLHGAHVPARYDGYPERDYPPGMSDTYVYPNNQLPGTLWYHDHALGITRLNVYMGMAGFYLLTDAYEQGLGLPSGPYEIGLAIQDRTFNPDGSLSYPATVKQNFFGDTILVNGKVWPYLNVDQGKYRFRLLGGSSSRTYVLSLSNGAPLQVIGNELGLRETPVAVTELPIAPGERYDTIIDFAPYSAGTEIVLQNSAPIKYPNTANPTEGVIPDILKFIVTANPGHTDPIPAMLRPFQEIPEAESVGSRVLSLDRNATGCGGGEWLINGLHWDDITEIPDLGTTEIWEWVNDSDLMHPMHMHLVAFQILDRYALDASGNPTGPPIPPAPHETGWKDTAMAHARTMTRTIARFEDYAGRYAYHCHILEHEDHEMMRQFQTANTLCDTSGACDIGEDCISCAADCGTGSGALCGNDLCEIGDGEDCLSCPQDCAGKQSGSAATRFCCGDGAGTNPVDCADTRCTTGGWFCRGSARLPTCCGDGFCEGSETILSCALDCSPDTDSDGAFDYADCDDDDPSVAAVPAEVAALQVEDLGGGALRLVWDSVGYQAGSGTWYDVQGGVLSGLRSAGSFLGGFCVSDDQTGTVLLDPTTTPPSGEGYYFLVRGQNACPATGTYGDATRDTTATGCS